MHPLTIVQPESVSPCIAMAEGGLATAQIFTENRLAILGSRLTSDFKTPNNL